MSFVNASRGASSSSYTIQEDAPSFFESEVELVDEEIKVFSYEATLFELEEILQEYDLVDEKLEPIYSDALSLEMIHWGRETTQLKLATIQDIVSVAKAQLNKLIETILIDPIDRNEKRPLVEPVILKRLFPEELLAEGLSLDERFQFEIGLFVEKEFADGFFKYCDPNAEMVYTTHAFALKMLNWSKRAKNCLDREIAVLNAKGVIFEEVPAAKTKQIAPARFNLFAAMARPNNSSPARPAPKTFREKINTYPEEMKPDLYYERFDHLLGIQLEKSSQIKEIWKLQQINLDSEQRQKELNEALIKLTAALRLHRSQMAERLQKIQQQHDAVVEALKADVEQTTQLLNETRKHQYECELQAAKLRHEIWAAHQENLRLQAEVQRMRDNMDDGGCTLF